MSLWMEVECLAGDRIEEVAADMCVLANRLHVGVQCDFNGVTLNMPVAGCAETLVKEFHTVVRTVHKYKLAFGYRKVSDEPEPEPEPEPETRLLEGPIEAGQEFIWEPDKPHARQYIIVTRVVPMEHDETRVWAREVGKPVGPETWNDESRFREACVRVTT